MYKRWMGFSFGAFMVGLRFFSANSLMHRERKADPKERIGFFRHAFVTRTLPIYSNQRRRHRFNSSKCYIIHASFPSTRSDGRSDIERNGGAFQTEALDPVAQLVVVYHLIKAIRGHEEAEKPDPTVGWL